MLTELSGEEAVRNEVLQIALLRYEGTSSALFEHLFNPQSIPVAPGANSRTSELLGNFAKEFRATEKSTNDLKGVRTSARQPSIPVATLEKYLLKKNAEIYWPYWQVTGKMKEAPTITYDPITNQEINIGYKRNADGSVEKVNVDDDYAYAHPTWIVKSHRELAAESPMLRKFSPNTEDASLIGVTNLIPIDCDYDGDDCGGYNPPAPKPTTPKPATPSYPTGNLRYNKLYVYDVKLNGNFRGLFGGDNDVDFIFAGDGTASYSKGDQNRIITTGASTCMVTIDRWAGRNNV